MLRSQERWSERRTLRVFILVLMVAGFALSQNLSITEFVLPGAGRPMNITTGPDGALWFTVGDVPGSSENQIGRITTAGVITLHSLPVGSRGSFGIAAGPDSALWFTESDKIGRITTNGAITEYPLRLAANGYPAAATSIVAGPDGALWFTERNANMVGRITTAGGITEYPVTTAGSNPTGIAVGPDGALWFTERGASKVGRITTSGVIAEYPLPAESMDFNPFAIVKGPDGALWFTELGSIYGIGRMTTAGNLTQFSMESDSTGYGMTTGPDRALWFVRSWKNKIARMTMTGSVTDYDVPTAGGFPHGITVGPDGALWFTELNGSRIGRIIAAQGLISGMPPAGCTLWPPNGQIVEVARVTAPNALPGSLRVTGYSNEVADFAEKPDIVIERYGEYTSIQLRAARAGSGSGRVYMLTATATNFSGYTDTVTASCTVPHDSAN
jgi:virginiamycin B lyase